jgi:clusterin-associated protein 1
MADGYAVKELLKVANVMYEATSTKFQHDDDVVGLPPLDISSKLPQLKACRSLASEIIEQGSKLYDSLGRELELRDVRQAVIARPFDLKTMEASVNNAIVQYKEQISSMKTAIENLAADEANLMSKIDKKKVELDRAEKRLKSLQSVRYVVHEKRVGG